MNCNYKFREIHVAKNKEMRIHTYVYIKNEVHSESRPVNEILKLGDMSLLRPAQDILEIY